jgi:hypothetical protein
MKPTTGQFQRFAVKSTLKTIQYLNLKKLVLVCRSEGTGDGGAALIISTVFGVPEEPEEICSLQKLSCGGWPLNIEPSQ